MSRNRDGSHSSVIEPNTMRDTPAEGEEPKEPLPGLVLVYSVDRPCWQLLPQPISGEPIELGREPTAGGLNDGKVSRRHARVVFTDNNWVVHDLGSTNGSFVDGLRVEQRLVAHAPRVLRLGRSLFLFSPNLLPFQTAKTEVFDGFVIGPSLANTHQAIIRAAKAGENLLITGASGSGKELAARVFHSHGPNPKGPFVAVNCATIPQGLAERLLFGARKGAYSGADADVDGYLQAADTGTLFLDEIAELETEVQAKLLRTMETKEVLPLGSTKTRTVNIRVVSATHRDLRRNVAQKKFREDLYFRIARPEIRLPSLYERREEIPWHIATQLNLLAETGPQMVADATFVETCLLRTWPGNVRELLAEIRRACLNASGNHRTSLLADDLDTTAGKSFQLSITGASAAKSDTDSVLLSPDSPRDEIEEALWLERGNVSRAATRLGIHRNRVRRWLEKHDLDRKVFQSEPKPKKV
jgi:DNA-binding NtrC family response regulator